jgi:tetratricopeptide (TPR) repeat protein
MCKPPCARWCDAVWPNSVPHDTHALTRFMLHDLTFAYAREKNRQARGRGTEARLEVVRAFLQREAENYELIGQELPNILGAARVAAQQQLPVLVEMMCWLCVGGYPRPFAPSYFDIRGHDLPMLRLLDAAIRLAEHLGQDEAAHHLWGKRGNAYHDQGNLERSRQAYQASLASAPNNSRRVFLMAAVGKVAGELGDKETANKLLQEAAQLAQSIGDDSAYSYVLQVQSFWAAQQQDFQRTYELATTSIDLAKRMQDKEMLCFSLLNKGSALRDLNRVEEAVNVHLQALEICRRNSLQVIEAYLLQALGEDYFFIGQLEKSRDYFITAISCHRQTGGTDNIAYIHRFCQKNNLNIREDLNE